MRGGRGRGAGVGGGAGGHRGGGESEHWAREEQMGGALVEQEGQ